MQKLGGERFAQIRTSAATVFREEQHQAAQSFYVRALDHLPPPPFWNDEVGGDEDGEVAGERALAKL
ncbi:hypothetical protein GCM10011411_01700 [Aurantiacibacter arachoides]|nr:hypothetical protein GCM10011411_01700 [Aurantiacibacter arachoides]